MKHIIREMAPECAELSYYFDDDGLTEKGGDYCYNLFIIQKSRWGRIDGFNTEEYTRIVEQAETILEYFYDEDTSEVDRYNELHHDLPKIVNNLQKYLAIKKWAADITDVDETETIADFLTIITGKKWDVTSETGYPQGDYCEIVYCIEHYENPGIYGEIWLGCGKEFVVIDLDENGDETDSCGGYIVADSQAWKEEDCKRLICKWAGIDEKETALEMIDGCYTTTHYNYRTI